MEKQIIVTTQHTNNLHQTLKWLNGLPDLIACDFEVASKVTKKEQELLKFRLNNFSLDKETQRAIRQLLNTSGLSHPNLTILTHFSVAWSNHESYVIVTDSEALRRAIYLFLVETDRTVIFHNYPFDGKHILYHTGKFVKNLMDTMLLAKSLLNDANPFKDKVGLKDLMGYAYGAWAISKDNFIQEEQWNPDVIKYAGIDSCAAYKLYEDLQEEMQKWKI